MKCIECKAENTVHAIVVVTKTVPIVKGGGVGLQGVSVTQADIRAAYADSMEPRTDGKPGSQRLIFCQKCESEFLYRFTPEGRSDGMVLHGEPTSAPESPEPPTDDAPAEDAPVVKRGVGRPRKTPVAAEAPVAKKAVGRPKKAA